MVDDADSDLVAVVANEVRLLDPAVRSSTRAVESLLHQGFREFGASGRVWDRDSVVAALTADPGSTYTSAEAIETVRLAPDVVLLTYVARQPHRTTRRSSLWRRVDGDWKLYFHQGTPMDD
jgi:hypothetical protein